MTSAKKGQIIAIVSLLLGVTLYWHFHSRTIFRDDLLIGCILMLVVALVLTYVRPLEHPRLIRSYILATSAWIICTFFWVVFFPGRVQILRDYFSF